MIVRLFLLLSFLFMPNCFAQAESNKQFECSWKAEWKNKKRNEERTYEISAKNGVRFGLDGDFLCTVTPVSSLSLDEEAETPSAYVDLNCKYPETDRGFATSLFVLSASGAFEQSRLFLLDYMGEIAHSITLTVKCE